MFYIYLQNAEQVERLNESGELRQMLKIYKVRQCSELIFFLYRLYIIQTHLFVYLIFLTFFLVSFRSLQCLNSSYVCPVCGGYRLLPCPSCNGSKKSVHRNHFTTEFVALKCMNCDEVGLVKCYSCN